MDESVSLKGTRKPMKGWRPAEEAFEDFGKRITMDMEAHENKTLAEITETMVQVAADMPHTTSTSRKGVAKKKPPELINKENC